MKNESTGKHMFGSWKMAFIAASVACGLSGCAEGADSGEELDGQGWEGDDNFPGTEEPHEPETFPGEGPFPGDEPGHSENNAPPPADNAFPVVGYVLGESCSNGFGDPRPNGRTHEGLDCFAAQNHAPLVAVENATIRVVRTAAESPGFSGNSISIRGDSGWRYYYGHIESTPFRKADEGVTRVQKGQVIALMGSTGTSVEHLHFEAAPGNSDAVDPYPFMGTWQRTAGDAAPPAPAGDTPPPPPPPPPVPGCGMLVPGEVLAPGEIMYSCDGRFQMQLQTDGNMVLRVVDYVALWTSGTHGTSPSGLVMQEDGNLVLYGTDGSAIWHIGTHGNAGAHLTLQDDGNLVVYRGNTALWNTGPA